MERLAVFALAGLVAELLGGALGMGYGITCTSMLLVAGLTPAAASASVHMAEVGTTFASGLSHWRFRNVDWRLTARLGLPGAVGSFGGAVLLGRLSTKAAAPLTNSLLLVLGLYILARFALNPPSSGRVANRDHGKGFLVVLGMVGGFVDATGGGGWGPVTTSTLLGAGRTAPRTVIGSVDASKFVVSVAAVLGFLVSSHHANFQGPVIIALLVGGVIAAPIGAALARHLAATLLGTLVGGFVIFLALQVLLAGVGGALLAGSWIVFVLVWSAALAQAVRRLRAERATARSANVADQDQDEDERVRVVA